MRDIWYKQISLEAFLYLEVKSARNFLVSQSDTLLHITLQNCFFVDLLI